MKLFVDGVNDFEPSGEGKQTGSYFDGCFIS
jgi:hypothetical protein